MAPTGKQNSFASRARASYILAEKGDQQPRSLAVAFLSPVKSELLLDAAINRLTETRERMDAAYEACADDWRSMNVQSGEGTLRDIIAFARS